MSRYLNYVAAAFLLAPYTSHAQEKAIPKHVPGEYFFTKRVCFVGPPTAKGEITWTDCGDVTDTLTIRHDPNDKITPLSIAAEFTFTNGHSCSFQGRGSFIRDRVISVRGECHLVLFFSENRVHTVTQGDCSSMCGARGSLDGAILTKRLANAP